MVKRRRKTLFRVQPPVKHRKSQYLFQNYRAGHSNFSTCKLCIPKIAGKFPPWKAASAFEANVWNLHQLKSGTCWIYWAWTISHCKQWGKKEREKKRKPFTSVPYRPDLMALWATWHGYQQLSNHDHLINTRILTHSWFTEKSHK